MSRFLTLLGVGVVIGILIAPEKGSVTRKRLTDFLDDLTDEVKDQTDRIRAEVKREVNNLEQGPPLSPGA